VLLVARELLRRRDELVVGPVAPGALEARALERLDVVVDDERGDVLRDALEPPVHRERVDGLRIEVRGLDLRRVDDPAPRVAAEVAVVDEEDVRRIAARERRQELGQVRLAIGDLDELHLAPGLGLVVTNELAVGLELLRVAEELERHLRVDVAAALVVVATARRDRDRGEQREHQRPSHPASLVF
jgi:hypothetical protein